MPLPKHLPLLLLPFLFLIVTPQSSPIWIRNPQIDVGEVKPINMDVAPSDAKTPNTTFNYNQHFNKTDFGVVPQVVIAQLAFAFFTNAGNRQSLMGYNVTMGTVNTLNFNLQISTLQITIFGLHFIYLAVSPVYQHIYFMDNHYLNFATNDQVRDISQGAIRTQNVTLINPEACITSFGSASTSGQLVLQTWILGYYYAPNGFISLNISSEIVSNTSFQLNIEVSDDFSLHFLAITSVLVNRTQLLQHSYTSYIDITIYGTIGNGGELFLIQATSTDFEGQYFFRNALTGLTGTRIQIISANTAFYYNFTSSPTSIQTGHILLTYSRQCSTGIDLFYFYQNKTCLSSCPSSYYFTNTSFNYCISCHYTCYSCSSSNQAQDQCVTCQAAMLRQLTNNSFCTCFQHFFDNGTVLCQPCHNTCLTCQNELITGCLSCDTNNSRILDINTGKCICDSGFVQNSTNQCQSSSGCGDGIISPSEECDDNNNEDQDGCSSLCQIQNDHQCIENGTISNHSLCYYSGKVNMEVSYVYKVPIENQVQMEVNIHGDNLNRAKLKEYLQNSNNAVQFVQNNNRRLLTVAAISKTSTIYQSSTQLVQLDFTFNQSIDLSTISLKLSPSQTTTHSYFFQTPSTTLSLPSPNNKLQTTYLTPTNSLQNRILSYSFLILICLTWLLWLISAFFHQSAIFVESMLVVQLAFQGILQAEFLEESWTGIIIWGKYTYGYNVDVRDEGKRFDRMTVVDMREGLGYNVNVAVGIIGVTALVIGVVWLYQTYKHSNEENIGYQSDDIRARGSTSKMVHQQSQQQPNEGQNYSLKRKIVLVSLEIGLSFTLLTVKIMFICLALTSNSTVSATLAPFMVLLIFEILLWVVYIKGYELQFMKKLSFIRILRKTQPQDENTPFRVKLSNKLLKYHYPLIYLSLLFWSLLSILPSLGSIFFILTSLFSLLYLFYIFYNSVYFRTVHFLRSFVNVFIVVVIMILLFVQSLKEREKQIGDGQRIGIGVAAAVSLYVGFIVTIVVFVRGEIRRVQKEGKKKINSQKVKHRKQRQDTQEPVILQPQLIHHLPQHPQNIQEEDPHIDRSHLALRQKDKFSSDEGQSYQFTQKKMIRMQKYEEEDGPDTKEKEWNVQKDFREEKMNEKTEPKWKQNELQFQRLETPPVKQQEKIQVYSLGQSDPAVIEEERQTEEKLSQKNNQIQINNKLKFQEL